MAFRTEREYLFGHLKITYDICGRIKIKDEKTDYHIINQRTGEGATRADSLHLVGWELFDDGVA